MESEKQAGGELANDGVVSEPKQDVVSYESYNKAVTEAKKAKESARDLEAKMEALSSKLGEYETAKMEAEGKHVEVIAQLREQLKTAESKLKDKDAVYSLGQIKSAVQSEAVKRGCTNIDALMRLVEVDDVKGIEVRDDYSVNMDDVSNLVEGYQKKYEGLSLFKKQSAKIYDQPLTSKSKAKGKSIDEMSSAELETLIKQQFS